MTFRVGQKVVFVGGAHGPNANIIRTATGLKKGTVYTVRHLEPVFLPFFGEVGVAVEEVVNVPVLWCGQMIEPVHRASRFRPVIERKTDISIFTELLKPKQYSKELCDND